MQLFIYLFTAVLDINDRALHILCKRCTNLSLFSAPSITCILDMIMKILISILKSFHYAKNNILDEEIDGYVDKQPISTCYKKFIHGKISLDTCWHGRHFYKPFR